VTEGGKGTGKEIAAEGKAELERGSEKLGHKPATASDTSTGGVRQDIGAASRPERTGPSTASDVPTKNDTSKGQKTTGSPTSKQERQSGDTANDPDPAVA